MNKPEKQLYCCDRPAKWVVQSNRLFYWFCEKCRNEVTEKKEEPAQIKTTHDWSDIDICMACGIHASDYANHGTPCSSYNAAPHAIPGVTSLKFMRTNPTLCPHTHVTFGSRAFGRNIKTCRDCGMTSFA